MIKLSVLMAMYNTAPYIEKALDSIPRRDDIEVLIRDNASTDGSLEIVEQYKKGHPNLNLMIFANEENRGFAYSINLLMESAQGEWYHTLDSDDFLYTGEYNKAIEELSDDYDVVYINLRTNGNDILVVDPNNVCSPVANTTKFVRREFAKGLKHREDRIHDADWFFNADLLARNPRCKYTGIIAYHYNYPRSGSLMDLYFKGLEK